MEKRLFFSAESAHGSESSHGFANDTIVYAWDSKKSRDNYVKTCSNISTKAIKKNEVVMYATNWSLDRHCHLKPRRTEFWGIVDVALRYAATGRSLPDGMVGRVDICDNYGSYPIAIRSLY